MRGKTSYAEFILEKISVLTRELEDRSIPWVLLNDLAVILYGIIKPVEEIRILVKTADYDELSQLVSSSLGMHIYKPDIYKSLNQLGKAVLNPVFIPLTIIETPETRLDEDLLSQSITSDLQNRKIRVPRLEHLIAKLLSYVTYPYNVYAYTLFYAHKEVIDKEKLYSLLKITGSSIKELESIMRKIDYLSQIFPEVSQLK